MSSPEPRNMLLKQIFQGKADMSAIYVLCSNMGFTNATTTVNWNRVGNV